MQGNNNWYPPQQQRQAPYQDGHHGSPESSMGRVAADSVQDAQRLLAIYPMASATPSVHVARHLETMSSTAAPPSFAQPSYYSTYPPVHQGRHPVPYVEYQQAFSYLASPQRSNDQSSYWSRTRDEAVTMLRSEVNPAYMHQNNSTWVAQQNSPSHHANPYAQSVFQQLTPASAYPTPPPGINTSSSSLAFALGMPQSHPSASQVYHPQQSSQFFNDFLNQTAQEAEALRSQPIRRPQPPVPSPDPLALKSVTPRKRKYLEPIVEIPTPSKRLQVAKAPQAPPTPRSNSSPSIPPTPTTTTKKPKRELTIPYIDVPSTPSWATPSSSKNSLKPAQVSSKVKDDDDLGGYGSVDDESPQRNSDPTKSSSRRTGDRDERVPLEKLISLIEDVFEAEDSLATDIDVNDLPPDFFSRMTVDSTRPLLNISIIKKLTKYVSQVARPPKRMHHGQPGGTPRVKGRMAGVDVALLSRILKLLERSVKAGEDLDPFPGGTMVRQEREKTASPRKPKVKKTDRRSKSRTPADGDDHESTPGLPPSSARSGEVDFDALSRTLEVAKESVAAADCCLAILASDRLAKQVYSEELITSCLNTIKNQLTKIIYPFVEASVDIDSKDVHPSLYHLIKTTSASSPDARRNRSLLSEVFQCLSSAMPRANALINAETVAMSDSIIIQAVYIAIGPFFVDQSGDGDVKGKKENIVLSTFGKSAMRGLRLDAMALIRSIFANHEDQRSWIIEEILSSLIKLSDTKQKASQYRLRDGRSIRTVSALLLQLVQTSAHDVRLEARRIAKARQQASAMKRQESFTESQSRPEEPFLDEHDKEEIRLYGSGLDSAIKAAKTIVLFLTTRSGKGKTIKNSNEAEYRTIFDNLISDLLVVLYWPEWPAASLLLSVACKYMVSSLDDVKSVSSTDNNAAKTIALDHLGVIAARIRTSALKTYSSTTPEGKSKALKPLDETITERRASDLKRLLSAHRDISAHLSKRASEDQAYDSARELNAATLGQELARGLEQVNAWISHQEDDEDLILKDDSQLLTFGELVRSAMRDVWKDPGADVFDVGSQDEVARVDRLAEEIGTIQSLRNSFQPILNVILLSLDAPPIFMRTKALKALGQIITSDSTILATPNVRRAIESHLLDSSSAVRDAAVELIGKYMLDFPDAADDYYVKIADRIADTGLSVRKRVIKLLKTFYGTMEDTQRRIDIATRLVLRMLDDDDTVKDLAIKVMEELWFQNPLPPSAMKKPRSTSPVNKGPLLNKVAVIMGVAANFRDRQSPLEDLLHKIMSEKQGSEASSLHARYSEVCEALIDGLVDDSDLPGFTVLNCVRTIYLFTAAYPSVLLGAHASTLLPYLKNATSVEEQAISDNLLRIFRASIPHMPKTEAKFGAELQALLQPMIVKPSGGISALQESVACICTVVRHLTHDFSRLAMLLKSCNNRLQDTIRRPNDKPLAPNDQKTLSVLISIVALLGEHCNFDQLRVEDPVVAKALDSLTDGSIMEHIYRSLLTLYERFSESMLRGRILQCLGFLFRAQPTLMLLPGSASIMDAIFSSSQEEEKGRLLKIMQDFLVSEASKHSAKEKEANQVKSKSQDVNMDELVGNTDGFADSGVSSAVVQRYLNHILAAALSDNVQIQAAAIDILTFTVKQGLAHPLQSVPVIVALETSTNTMLSNRANALHAILHAKHASLINTRYLDSARAAFNYQKKVSDGPVQGYRLRPTPSAVLQRWYSLVKEKRAARQDFLRALLKVFDGRPAQQCTQDDVDFIRFMAENFAAFDYKTLEEVLTVIKILTAVLSTTGAQLLEVISPSHLLAQLRSPQEDQNENLNTDDSSPHAPQPGLEMPVMLSSIIIGMIMILKAHLKYLYNLNEDKCNKFVLGKKSTLGDKQASARNHNPISWERLPYATKPLLTTEDMRIQKATFLDIWNEDGVAAEPEDEFP